MKAAGAFNGLPRPKLRWNMYGYIDELKSFSIAVKPSEALPTSSRSFSISIFLR
jgi:hypothetical protein